MRHKIFFILKYFWNLVFKMTFWQNFWKSTFLKKISKTKTKIFGFLWWILLDFLLEFVAWRGSMRVNRSLTQRAASSFSFFSLDPPPSLTLNTKIELEIHFIEIYMKKNYGHVTRMRSKNQKRSNFGLLAVVTLTVISPVHAILPNQISNSGQYSQEFLAAFEKRLLQVWPFYDLWLTRDARDLGLSTNLYPTINDLGGIILIFLWPKRFIFHVQSLANHFFLVILRCTSG